MEIIVPKKKRVIQNWQYMRYKKKKWWTENDILVDKMNEVRIAKCQVEPFLAKNIKTNIQRFFALINEEKKKKATKKISGYQATMK